MRMDVLRCKTVEGVHKELLMYAVIYNLVRQVMLQAAEQQNVPVERISFIESVSLSWFHPRFAITCSNTSRVRVANMSNSWSDKI